MEPEKIFQLLKEKIIKLELLPGSVLNLSELAKSFNLSRTPVKEAAIMLHAEGWILRESGYFTVTPLSLKLIKEITEIRSSLEIQANLWAMQRIDSEEIRALDELKKKVLGLSNGLSNKEMIELDIQFLGFVPGSGSRHRLSFSLEEHPENAPGRHDEEHQDNRDEHGDEAEPALCRVVQLPLHPNRLRLVPKRFLIVFEVLALEITDFLE